MRYEQKDVFIQYQGALVASECGFEYRPDQSQHLCPWARHVKLIIALSLGPVCKVMHV